MFNVNGVARATNLKEVSPRLIVGSVYCSEKVDDNNWETTFLKCKLVGNALVGFIQLGLKEKDKFVIEKSVLKSNKYTNKNGETVEELVLTIFEINHFIGTKEDTKPVSKFKR